jgi:hypothetical protein
MKMNGSVNDDDPSSAEAISPGAPHTHTTWEWMKANAAVPIVEVSIWKVDATTPPLGSKYHGYTHTHTHTRTHTNYYELQL